MRIFFISPEFIHSDTLSLVDGGLASYLDKITNILSKQGHDINVVVLCSLDKEFTYNNIKVYFINWNKKLKENFLFKFIPHKLKKYLTLKQRYKKISDFLLEQNKIKKIDFVQYASWQATGLYACPKIPHCIRISSYAKLWQKNYGYSDPEEIRREKVQFRENKFLYGPSSFLNTHIQQDLNLKRKITLIETPYAPLANFSAELSDVLKSQIGSHPYLLFFGTIGTLKGASEIADIIYEVLKTYQNFSFVFAGKSLPMGNRPAIDIIKECAKEFKNRVIALGALSHEQLFPVIQNAEAVILPSRVDNLPNACIEAMGMGKIVIGSRGASFEQLITDEESGFLCNASDAGSLLSAIKRFMDTSATQRQAIENAAKRRIERLDPALIANDLLAYYHEIIQNWK